MTDPRYPIGKFTYENPPSPEQRRELLANIEAAPAKLRAAVSGLSDKQLDTPYRPGGWTVRQVAHHVPDSHLNAYVRFRLALTEDTPVIKTYEEDRWAELPDARSGTIEPSLELLARLHERWVRLLRAMTPADFKRGLRYPGSDEVVTLARMAGLYAWHSKHHP